MAECPLTTQQSFAHPWERGNLARGIAHFLGTDGAGDILPFQHDLHLLGIDLELHVQIGSQGNQRSFGIELYIVMQGGQGQHPIDGAGIEQVPTQFSASN